MSHVVNAFAISVALVVFIVGAARPARAGHLEGSVGAGVVVGRGFSELNQRPALGADVTMWWTPVSGLDLGMVLGADVSRFPYGYADGEPDLGDRSGYAPDVLTESVTLLPRALLGARKSLGERAGLSLSIGPTSLVSGPMGEFSIIPHPMVALAVDVALGADRRFGLRAGVSYLYFWLNSSHPAFITPSLAFTWR